jgi:RNase adaptor protein for sRNA GlmZ degradation
MDRTTVKLELPASLYADLESLAENEEQDPVEVIAALVNSARHRRAWLRDLEPLRAQVRDDGGLHLGATKEQVVARMRQTRRQIFEAEYAHLYR